ncbi:unnamed protein product [Closterium sp. NIES-54]
MLPCLHALTSTALPCLTATNTALPVAQCCPTLPGRRQCCPAHCPALPVLPCTLPSAALPCLATTSTALHAAQHCQAAAAICCCRTSPNCCTTNTASPAPRATCTRAPSYSRSSLAAPSLLLLAATDCHGHYHCPTSATAKCAGVSLAAGVSLREWAIWWGSPAVWWGATTGGTCESTPAGSASSRRGGSGVGQQQQQRPLETLSPQQLREWAVRWGSPGGGGFRGTRNWGVEAPGGIEATSLGAFDSSSAGAEPEEAFHTFTLDSSVSRCFFRNSTTVTPLTAPVPVTLADPSGGPVVTTVLPYPAAPSGLLTGLHLPSFAKNLVATFVLQDQWVTVTQPGGELMANCTDSRTGEHLATFTRRPGSGLYTLTTELSSGTTVLATPPCHAFMACTPVSLSLGFPSPYPHSLGCLRRCAFLASRGGSAPLLTPPRFLLHMDVRGPDQVPGHGGERYFLLVVDDYTRYTTVFPLKSKAEVCSVSIRWIRAVHRQLRARFQQDLPVLRLHSDQDGEFSSSLLEEFCGAEGIRHTFTLPASPQHNGIAKRRIGLVMAVARTSIVHAAPPYFMWPFAARYAAEQLNLWPRVSHIETERSPGGLWAHKPATQTSPSILMKVALAALSTDAGWAPHVHVESLQGSSRRGKRGGVRSTILQSFMLPDSPQQNGIAERRIGLVMEVAHTSMIHAAAPHFLWPFADRYAAHQLNLWPRVSLPETSLTLRWTGEVGDASMFRGPAPSGVSQVEPLPGPVPVQVAVGSGAPRGAASGGAAFGGAEPGSAESEGAETRGAEPGGVATRGGEPGGVGPEGVEPGGAVSEGAESTGAEPQGVALYGVSAGASPRLSPQQMREWFVWRTRPRSGASGAAGAGAAGVGGGGVAAGAGVTGGTATTGPGGARTRGTGAAGSGGVEGAGAGDLTESGATGAGAVGAGGAGVGGPGAGGTGVGGPGVRGAGAGGAGVVDPGGAVRLRSYFVPLL